MTLVWIVSYNDKFECHKQKNLQETFFKNISERRPIYNSHPWTLDEHNRIENEKNGNPKSRLPIPVFKFNQTYIFSSIAATFYMSRNASVSYTRCQMFLSYPTLTMSEILKLSDCSSHVRGGRWPALILATVAFTFISSQCELSRFDNGC